MIIIRDITIRFILITINNYVIICGLRLRLKDFEHAMV